nr:hypothetical protein Iba_chr15fCG4360 [Ipomoea batatas]
MSTRKRRADISLTASSPLALRQIAPRPLGTQVRAFGEGSIPATTEDRKAFGRPRSCKNCRTASTKATDDGSLELFSDKIALCSTFRRIIRLPPAKLMLDPLKIRARSCDDAYAANCAPKAFIASVLIAPEMVSSDRTILINSLVYSGSFAKKDASSS